VADNPTPISLEQRLNEAAELLLSQFIPSIHTFAIEVADVVLKIPRWQLICGSMLAQFESGCLQAPSIDPSWHREGTEIGQRECAYCRIMFTPFKAFQETCSNDCGTALMNERNGKKNEPIQTSLPV
jgi:predicted nucleic acid-binding Zn ribbon protein